MAFELEQHLLDGLRCHPEGRDREQHEPIAEIFKFADAEVGCLPEFCHVGDQRCGATFLGEVLGKRSEFVSRFESLRENRISTGVDIGPCPSHRGV